MTTLSPRSVGRFDRTASVLLSARVLAALSCALLFVAGCGEADPLNRQAVTGVVTLDGEPIRQGSISFSPAGSSAKKPIGGGAAIDNGDYSLPSDRGLPPGRYVVRINAADQAASDPNEPPGESKPAKELVPASWNTNSAHEIEVTEGGSNDFPFEITSAD